MLSDLFKAFVLGVVEGLTEFVPVSSTGHLLLVQRFFGFDDDDFDKTFAVLIQFGAILALLSIYFFRLWRLALGFFNDPAARRFVNDVDHNYVDSINQRLALSRLFAWYLADFEAAAGTLVKFLRPLAERRDLVAALVPENVEIRHLPFDWRLNAAPGERIK